MTWTVTEAADDVAFVRDGVEWLVDRINAAIATDGRCILGLSGGSTPKPIYTELGKRLDIDWPNVFPFLIDERCVPANDDRSNQKLVCDSLLAHAKIPDAHIVWPDTRLDPEACALQYTRDLWHIWDDLLPHAIILGMGDDGHIASLFPPLADNALDDSALVVHTTTDRFDGHDRVGLSLNPITAARSHLLILKGENKRATWDTMLASDEDERRWPMKRVLEQEDVTILMQ